MGNDIEILVSNQENPTLIPTLTGSTQAGRNLKQNEEFSKTKLVELLIMDPRMEEHRPVFLKAFGLLKIKKKQSRINLGAGLLP